MWILKENKETNKKKAPQECIFFFKFWHVQHFDFRCKEKKENILDAIAVQQKKTLLIDNNIIYIYSFGVN